VTFAKDRNLEHTAVAEERALLRDALARGMGALSVAAVKREFEHRVDAGEFVEVSQRPDVPGPRLYLARDDHARAGDD
jgi:hypothetical protein